MQAKVGDIIYVSDARWYFGGLRSVHLKVTGTHNKEGSIVLPPEALETARFDMNKDMTVEKII